MQNNLGKMVILAGLVLLPSVGLSASGACVHGGKCTTNCVFGHYLDEDSQCRERRLTCKDGQFIELENSNAIVDGSHCETDKAKADQALYP